jgi:hypothetical protein
VDLVTEHKDTNNAAVHDKDNLKYFEKYFEDVKAGTIVVEYPYIDRGFIEDYAGYYSRCFHQYERFCTRLHFFDDTISTRQIGHFLKSLLKIPPTAEDSMVQALNNAYLGFFVVKPLPNTVIGRTCLRTYPEEDRRNYPTIRDYTANLFGLELKVQTLAFQEQDLTISRCATSALWSLLQASSVLFQHQELSPVQITTAAAVRFPTETRYLPSDGLSGVQIADVIRTAGLEPTAIDAKDDYVLKSTVFSYLMAGIPIIMCLAVGETPEETERELHAVTVTGFSLGGQLTTCQCQSDCQFLLRASRIDELYAHDDQVGPFAKMVFESFSADDDPDAQHKLPQLITPVGKGKSRTSCPLLLIMPLYHKIRIPFKDVFQATHEFDHYYRFYAPENFPKDLEWQIALIEINRLKESIFWNDDKCVAPINRSAILKSRLPRFMWRATACFEDQPFLELLFDATDIEQGRLFVGSIEYDSSLPKVLAKMAEELFREKGANFKEEPAGAVFYWYTGDRRKG